jgi:hypothetical protein
MATNTLRIGHASLQYDDPDTQVRADVDHFLTEIRPVVGGLTEVGSDEAPIVRAACDAAGYLLIRPHDRTGRRTREPIVLRKDAVQLVDYGHVWVIPESPGRLSEGGHEARGITWAEFLWEGNRITHNVFHVLRGYDGELHRDPEILEQIRAIGRQVRRTAEGRSLGFASGDLNHDPDDKSDNLPTRILRDAGLVSAWEDIGRPDTPTHGRRTIDHVFRYRGDTRVDEASAARAFRRYSDHRQIVAAYPIESLPA